MMSVCPVCGSEKHSEVYPAQIVDPKDVSFSYTFSPKHNRTFRVVRCLECTHVYCSPIPDHIAENYKDVVDEVYLQQEESRRLAAEAVIKQIQKQKPSGKLLDVGCASGDFLVAAKKAGFEAEGLELSKWSSTLAKGKGFVIHGEYLKTFAPKNAGQYDVITLIGVIEHFANPAEEIKYLTQLLKKDGVLVMWTGDVDSIMSRALGRKWWYWQSQHIQYFTHKSLRKLVEDAGLSYLQTKLYPFAASFQTISNSLARYKSQGLLKNLVKPFFAIKPIWYLRLPGEMLFFAQRKN